MVNSHQTVKYTGANYSVNHEIGVCSHPVSRTTADLKNMTKSAFERWDVTAHAYLFYFNEIQEFIFITAVSKYTKVEKNDITFFLQYYIYVL